MDGRSEKQRAQRARILGAARVLYAAPGDEPRMVDVAKAAGVSRATVFNHFGSKAALVEGMTLGVMTEYRDLLDYALNDRDTHTGTLIRCLFAIMGGGIEEDRTFFAAVFAEIARLWVNPDKTGDAYDIHNAALEKLEHLFTRGQARDEISRDHQAIDLAKAFDGLVFSTIAGWLFEEPQEPLRDRMLRAVDVILSPVALDMTVGHEGLPESLAIAKAELSARRIAELNEAA